jgi:nucleoside-diphosphate-sugar epimerase
MKIFVTGGTGFIGSHFLNCALAAEHEVVALRLPGDQPKIRLSKNPEWLDASLADDCSSHLEGCQALVHLAAVGVSPQKVTWGKLLQVNVVQSVQLWNQAIFANVKRLVICGSCFEYGRSGERHDLIPPDAPLEPLNAYAASKAAATVAALALAAEQNVEQLILRPFHVYGEGQHESNFWPSLKIAAFNGHDFPMTAGEQVRDFIPVEQVAAAFVRALDRSDLEPGQPKIENLGTGQPQSLRAFAEHWWKVWNAKGKLLPGALPYRNHEVMRYVPLISPA